MSPILPPTSVLGSWVKVLASTLTQLPRTLVGGKIGDIKGHVSCRPATHLWEAVHADPPLLIDAQLDHGFHDDRGQSPTDRGGFGADADADQGPGADGY